jgi:hypothetical protein
MRTRIQLPQQATPLCIAVNTLPSAATREERPFAESCGALLGFFMELLRPRTTVDQYSGIPLFAILRKSPN